MLSRGGFVIKSPALLSSLEYILDTIGINCVKTRH